MMHRDALNAKSFLSRSSDLHLSPVKDYHVPSEPLGKHPKPGTNPGDPSNSTLLKASSAIRPKQPRLKARRRKLPQR